MDTGRKTEVSAEALRVKRQLWVMFAIVLIMIVIGLLAFNRQVQKVGREAAEMDRSGQGVSQPLPGAEKNP